MDAYFSKDVYNSNPLVLLGIKNEDFNPDKDIINFINSRYQYEQMGVLCSNQNDVELMKLILVNFGIPLVYDYSQSKKGNVYLGIINEKYSFDSILFYMVDDVNKYLDWANIQKFIITDKEIDVLVDEYRLPQSIETSYLLYKKGLYKYTNDFTSKLLANDERQLGMLFSSPKYYQDMTFMGMISSNSNFSFTSLYENGRFDSCRDEILKYIGINLLRFFQEIIKTQKFNLVESVFFDYNKEMILNFLLDNEISVFDQLSSDLKYRLFIVSDRSVETIKKGIKLGLWTYLSIYQYKLVDPNILDLDSLAKEIEYSCDENLIISMLNDFDNKRVLDLAVQAHSNNYRSLPEHIKESAFLKVYDSLDSLEDGYILGLWNYEGAYAFALKHEETKPAVIPFLEANFERFAEKVSHHKNVSMAEAIVKDFPFEIIDEYGICILMYFDLEKRKELFDSVCRDRARLEKYYHANTWKQNELFNWYLEDKSLTYVKELLNKDLLLLIQDINRIKDEELFLKLFSEFDHKRVLVYAGNCNVGYFFTNMIKEDRDILFDELCNDFSSVEAGVRLHVWNSLDVYKFGLINIMQHDQIVRAINRNLDLFISDLKDNDSYEVLDNVLKDFEIIEIFDEAYRQRINIFEISSMNAKEDIIKAVFDNIKYLEWLMKSKAFTILDIYKICESNNLDCSKFYLKYHAEILPNIDPTPYLGLIVFKTNTLAESVTEINSFLRKGKGKKLTAYYDEIKEKGSDLVLAEVGLKSRVRPDLTKEEMLELLKQA